LANSARKPTTAQRAPSTGWPTRSSPTRSPRSRTP